MDWWQQQIINFLTGVVSGLVVYLIIKYVGVGPPRRYYYALVAAIIIFAAMTIASALCLFGLYDKQTYWPPPQTGDIYTVIDRKSSETICVAAEWGEWKKKDRINLANYNGLVLCLQHREQGAFPLTVKAKDAIVKIPNQGNPPPEWTDSRLKYKQVLW